MTKYTLIDPETGVMAHYYESRLLDQLVVNRILLENDEHIGIITGRDLISSNAWRIGRIMSIHSSKNFPASRRAVALVNKWLDDPESIDRNQLLDASRDAMTEINLSWNISRGAACVAKATAAIMEIGPYAAARELREFMAGHIVSSAGVSNREQLEQLVNIVRAG